MEPCPNHFSHSTSGWVKSGQGKYPSTRPIRAVERWGIAWTDIKHDPGILRSHITSLRETQDIAKRGSAPPTATELYYEKHVFPLRMHTSAKKIKHRHSPSMSERRPTIASHASIYYSAPPIDSCLGTLCKGFRPDCQSVGQDVDGKVVHELQSTRIWREQDEKTPRETQRTLSPKQDFFRPKETALIDHFLDCFYTVSEKKRHNNDECSG